jgi:hypothetical protein
LIPIVFFLLNIAHLVMGGGVGAARKRFGIPYPSLYAVPGTKADYSPGAAGESTPLKEASASRKGGEEASARSAASSSLIPDDGLITEANAYAFNCVQRGHQNFLEQVGVVGLALLLNWFTFPLIAGVCGIVWTFCKILYFWGYSRSVGARMWGAGAYLPQVSLYALTIASAVFLFQKKEAY